MRIARLIVLLLPCAVLLAERFGWDGPWMIVPIVAAGAGSFFVQLRERDARGADRPTTLGLHR